MKKKLLIFSLPACVFLFISCAAKQLPKPEATYEKGAIKIHVKADPQLHLSDGRPNSLRLCVYQLEDPNAFNHLAGNQEGLYKLLKCDLFDSGTAGAEASYIHPGKDTTLELNRAEGARYVSVIAGYNDIKKERILRMYEIPVVTERKKLIKKLTKLGPLEIELKLGPKQIE